VWSRSAPEGNSKNPICEDWNMAPRPPGISSLIKLSEVTLWETALSPLPTFLEWYGAWLDQCLSDLEELKREQQQESGNEGEGKSLVEKNVEKL
jgi:hypothetical protein